VGGEQRILVSELSGKGAVLRRARDIGLQLEGDKADVEATIKIHVGGERIISTA
jgi:hypothetical protein